MIASDLMQPLGIVSGGNVLLTCSNLVFPLFPCFFRLLVIASKHVGTTARTSSLLDFFKVERGGNPAVAQRAGALAHGVRVSLLAFVGDVLDLFAEGNRDFPGPVLRVAIQGDLGAVGCLGIDFGV